MGIEAAEFDDSQIHKRAAIVRLRDVRLSEAGLAAALSDFMRNGFSCLARSVA